MDAVDRRDSMHRTESDRTKANRPQSGGLGSAAREAERPDSGRRDAADIERLIAPVLEGMGYDLVRLVLSGRHAPTLQVMAERRDGGPMSVEACADISRALSAVLDVEDPIHGSYTLEISSPGLDRPLVKPADFDRFRGRTARIEIRSPRDGRRRFQGRLAGVRESAVVLETPEGAVTIALDDIARAKLAIDDALLKASLRREAD
jgi:ribosome maturation factor RimP